MNKRIPKSRIPGHGKNRDWRCTGCGDTIEHNPYTRTYGHVVEDCVVVLHDKLEALTRKVERMEKGQVQP